MHRPPPPFLSSSSPFPSLAPPPLFLPSSSSPSPTSSSTSAHSTCYHRNRAPKPSPSVPRPPIAISIPSAIMFDLSYSIIKFTTNIDQDTLLCSPLQYQRNSMVRHFPPNIVRSLQCLFARFEEFLSSWLLLKRRFDQFTAFPCSPFPFRGVFLFFFFALLFAPWYHKFSQCLFDICFSVFNLVHYPLALLVAILLQPSNINHLIYCALTHLPLLLP